MLFCNRLRDELFSWLWLFFPGFCVMQLTRPLFIPPSPAKPSLGGAGFLRCIRYPSDLQNPCDLPHWQAWVPPESLSENSGASEHFLIFPHYFMQTRRDMRCSRGHEIRLGKICLRMLCNNFAWRWSPCFWACAFVIAFFSCPREENAWAQPPHQTYMPPQTWIRTPCASTWIRTLCSGCRCHCDFFYHSGSPGRVCSWKHSRQGVFQGRLYPQAHSRKHWSRFWPSCALHFSLQHRDTAHKHECPRCESTAVCTMLAATASGPAMVIEKVEAGLTGCKCLPGLSVSHKWHSQPLLFQYSHPLVIFTVLVSSITLWIMFTDQTCNTPIAIHNLWTLSAKLCHGITCQNMTKLYVMPTTTVHNLTESVKKLFCYTMITRLWMNIRVFNS